MPIARSSPSCTTLPCMCSLLLSTPHTRVSLASSVGTLTAVFELLLLLLVLLQETSEAMMQEQLRRLQADMDARRRDMEDMQRRWEAERKELMAAKAPEPPPQRFGPMVDDEGAEVTLGWVSCSRSSFRAPPSSARCLPCELCSHGLCMCAFVCCRMLGRARVRVH